MSVVQRIFANHVVVYLYIFIYIYIIGQFLPLVLQPYTASDCRTSNYTNVPWVIERETQIWTERERTLINIRKPAGRFIFFPLLWFIHCPCIIIIKIGL